MRRPRAAWIWIALGIFLVVRTGVRDRGVITDHLEFGRRVLHGLDPYAPYLGERPLHAPYPPGFGILCAPFSLLPERLARFAWGAAQVLALFAIGAWLRRVLVTVAPALRGRLHLLLALTAVLGSRYVLRDTHGGGGNLINLALALTAFGLAERGRALAAGAALGLSLATKPTFVLLLPLLWAFGHRRAAGAAVIGAAGVTGAALLLLGQGLAPLTRWLEGAWAYARAQDPFATPEHGFPPFTWMNQCLRCAVARWLGEVPAEHAREVPGFVAGAGLAPAATALVSRALALVMLAVTAAVVWRRRDRGPARPALIAAVLALSLLLSPISWKAHHVALLPAFFLLFVRALSDPGPLRLRLAAPSGARWAWGVAAVYWALCVVGEEIIGKGAKQLQQSLYVVTAGTVLFWGLCLAWARRPAAGHSVPAPPGNG